MALRLLQSPPKSMGHLKVRVIVTSLSIPVVVIAMGTVSIRLIVGVHSGYTLYGI